MDSNYLLFAWFDKIVCFFVTWLRETKEKTQKKRPKSVKLQCCRVCNKEFR